MGRNDCPWTADGKHIPGCGCGSTPLGKKVKKRGKGDVRGHKHDYTLKRVSHAYDASTNEDVEYRFLECLSAGCPARDKMEIIRTPRRGR